MEDINNISEYVANALLDIKAVQFSYTEPFKWSSGWNSPIYCDSRLTISYPKIRKKITQGFVDLIHHRFSDIEALAGVATAGIPQATLIAQDLNLPMLYARSKPKDHGKGNQVEGNIVPGQKVVIIEDIISTGQSALIASQVLKEKGLEVLGVLAILTYGFDFANAKFIEANIPFFTLTDYTKLLVEVFKREGVSEESMASLHEWRKNPEKWQP